MSSSLVALICMAVLLGGIVILLMRKAQPRLDKAHFQKHWKKISEEPNQLAAMIAADSLVDEAMKKLGIKGKTMGERLNNSGAFIRDINATWAAHKLRNRLVHEPGVQVKPQETKRMLSYFRKALKDLGAL